MEICFHDSTLDFVFAPLFFFFYLLMIINIWFILASKISAAVFLAEIFVSAPDVTTGFSGYNVKCNRG